MAGWNQYYNWEQQKIERQALVELPRVDLTKANNVFNQMRQQEWSPPVQTVPDAFDFDGNKQLRSSENDSNAILWSTADSNNNSNSSNGNNNYAKMIGHWSSTESDRMMKIQQWMSSSVRMVPESGQFTHSSPKQLQSPEEIYSRKVFIGGLPPDIDEEILLEVFQQIGPVTIDWPHKDQSTTRFPPQGYAFLCFEQESSVHHLLNLCARSHGKYYTRLSSSSVTDKLVQVRPWVLADAEYNTQEKYKTDHRMTVFVGGVPRTITAEELALLIKKKFDGVCYAAIEVDGDYKYPKGAARVSFGSRQSYRAAVSTRFIKTSDSEKQMEMKPFLVEIAMCEACGCMSTRQFCASMLCLKYLCGACWVVDHVGPKINHKPVVKSSAERTRHRYPSVQL